MFELNDFKCKEFEFSKDSGPHDIGTIKLGSVIFRRFSHNTEVLAIIALEFRLLLSSLSFSFSMMRKRSLPLFSGEMRISGVILR
uniref:Uncharacterized protein n=1 Tax=Romanomermis culicivorax TaxID=13658 RepID=A0A915IAZ6_ROMCU